VVGVVVTSRVSVFSKPAVGALRVNTRVLASVQLRLRIGSLRLGIRRSPILRLRLARIRIVVMISVVSVGCTRHSDVWKGHPVHL
jgi:hypothetical protein